MLQTKLRAKMASLYEMINVVHKTISGLEGVTDKCKSGARTVHQHYIGFCFLGCYIQ